MATDDDKKRIKRNLINRQRGMWLSDRELRYLIDILDGKVGEEDVPDRRQGADDGTGRF